MDNQNSRRSFLGGLLWVYGETIAAQAVTFIVTILLARILSPNDYGTIALVMVFVNVANVFVYSSFSFALVQKRNVEDADYHTMFWFNLAVSAVLYLLLFIIAPFVSSYYSIPILCPILKILAIKVPVSAYNSIQLAKVAKEMKFKKSFVSTSGSVIISGVIGIIMAYQGYGIWALTVQVVLSAFLNTLLMMFIVDWHPKFVYSSERLKPLISYGWKLLATGLMYAGYAELCKLIIGKRYNTEDLGYYEKGAQFPQFISSNVDTTINRVLFPTLSNQQDNDTRLLEITRRSSKTSAFIMTPILFGLAITASTVVHLLLTDKWLPCVPFIQLMCFSWWFQPTQSCSIQGIKAIGRSDIHLRVEIIAKSFGILAMILSIVFFDTTLAIACSLLCAQLFSVILYGFYSERLLGYKIKDQIKDLFSCGIVGAFMMVAVYFVGKVNVDNSLLILLIQILVGAVVYLAFSKILKLEEYEYIKGLVFRAKITGK